MFQAMLMMNLVDASVLQQVVASTGQQSQPAAPPQSTYPPRPSVPPAPTNIDPQRVYSISAIFLTDLAGSDATSDEFDGRTDCFLET